MYQLVTSRYKTDRRAGRWLEGDLSNEKITSLSSKYPDVWFFITYPSSDIQRALRLDSLVNMLSGVEAAVTVQQWLTAQGNKTLPFASVLPTFDVKLVEYVEAWHAEYDIQAMGRYGVVEDNKAGPAREDLLITHEKHTPQKINDYALISVNGYFHLTDYNEQGVRVIDGQTTVKVTNENEVGLYSFEAIGKIKRVPITLDMITAMNDTAPLWEGAYVTLPDNIDLENKTVLLVVGGYLMVLNEAYKRVGERTWNIELVNLMFLDRFLQSRQHIDLSSLGIQSPDNNPSFALVERLKGDDAIKAYLTISQSFFVVVDAPSLFQEYEPIESLGFGARYVSSFNKQLPLVGAYGKMLDYHIIKEDDEYVYCSVDNYRNNYDANRRNWATSVAVDGGRYPSNPKKEAMAFLRYIGCER